MDRKLKAVLDTLDMYRTDTEEMFMAKFTENLSGGVENKFESLKNTKFSQPTSIDPAGMVGKLEHILDTSENKFKRFVEGNADTEDEEELADLNMAFKGVMGTHQIYKVVRRAQDKGVFRPKTTRMRVLNTAVSPSKRASLLARSVS